MSLSGTWWILCAASLSCVARFGSCGRHRQADGAPPELFIFNELCALKDEPGPCKAIKERFFFNVDAGHCELFEYGGCGGNANNFETLEACEDTCVVSDKNPCHLAEAPGPCRGLVKRYLFDSRSQQCQPFFYGGCFGNANNFRSMAECQAKCQNPVSVTTEAPELLLTQSLSGAPVQPTITGELVVIQPLMQHMNDTDDQVTEEVKPKGVCFSAVDRGTCHGADKRFAYNPTTKRCQMFHYSGCGGNGNNFTSRKHCIRKCIRRRKAHGKMMIRIRRKNIGNIVHRSF